MTGKVMLASFFFLLSFLSIYSAKRQRICDLWLIFVVKRESFYIEFDTGAINWLNNCFAIKKINNLYLNHDKSHLTCVQCSTELLSIAVSFWKPWRPRIVRLICPLMMTERRSVTRLPPSARDNTFPKLGFGITNGPSIVFFVCLFFYSILIFGEWFICSTLLGFFPQHAPARFFYSFLFLREGNDWRSTDKDILVLQ